MHRFLAATHSVAGSLRRLAAIGSWIESGAGAASARGLSLVSAALGPDNLGFLAVVLATMALDLATRIACVYLSRGASPRQGRLLGGIIGKLLRLSMVLVASLLDWTVILAVPESGTRTAPLMPVTRGALVWLIVVEAGSVLQSVRQSQGDSVVPAPLIRALERLRPTSAGLPGRPDEPPRGHTEEERTRAAEVRHRN